MALAALIVSIIALVLGLVLASLSIARRVWGKSDLIVKFDLREVEGGRVMTCQLYNPLIVKGIKKKIGVQRMPIEDLVAHFSVVESGSNKVIYPGKVPYIQRHDGIVNAQRISLPASVFPAWFGVVSMAYDTKAVKVFEEDIDLPVGNYIVKVNATFQEKERNAERTLTVHKQRPYAYWR